MLSLPFRSFDEAIEALESLAVDLGNAEEREIIQRRVKRQENYDNDQGVT